MDFKKLQSLIEKYVARFDEQPPMLYMNSLGDEPLVEKLEDALEAGRPIDSEKDLGIPADALV